MVADELEVAGFGGSGIICESAAGAADCEEGVGEYGGASGEVVCAIVGSSLAVLEAAEDESQVVCF